MNNQPMPSKTPSSWLHTACAAMVLCGGFVASTFLMISSEEIIEPVAIPERPTVTWQPVPTAPAILQFGSMGRVVAARPTTLPSPVSARVTQVHPALLAGGQVAAGETLVTFDTHDLAVTEAHAAARLAEAEEAFVRAANAARRAQAELGDDPQALAKASPLRLGTPQQASAKARVNAAAAEYQQAQARSQQVNLRAPEDIWVLQGGIAIGEQTVLGAPLAEYLPRDTSAVHIELPLSDTQATWLEAVS
jgi:multidrug resistance efflux pump